ncbi:MAG TPA: hypothetical protein VGL98_11725 [Gammaproteobacteria bacterium]
MRWLRLATSAIALAAWLAGAVAQQGAPPAGTPPPSTPPAGTPPPRTPPASTPQPQPSAPQPAASSEEKEAEQQAGADADDEFIPTEELQPDAAVTFPVDI